MEPYTTMKIPLRQFYAELIGTDHFSVQTAINALNRWEIPLEPLGKETANGSAKRKRYQVDLAHLAAARGRHKLEAEMAKVHAPRDASIKPDVIVRLDEIMSHIRGLEVGLNALLKLAKS